MLQFAGMTLEQLFYSLGLVLIVSWLIILIVFVVLTVVMVRRFRAFKKKFSNITGPANNLKFVNPNNLKTLLTVLPFLQIAFGLLKKKKSKRKA